MYWWSVQQLFILLLFSPLLARHVFDGYGIRFLLFVCLTFAIALFAEHQVKKNKKAKSFSMAAVLCNILILLGFAFFFA